MKVELVQRETERNCRPGKAPLNNIIMVASKIVLILSLDDLLMFFDYLVFSPAIPFPTMQLNSTAVSLSYLLVSLEKGRLLFLHVSGWISSRTSNQL